jgi:ribonuclease E
MSRPRKMLINAADPEEFRVAILEEGLLSEFALEAASRKQTKGNIYKGVVSNVEPSLQAAFVNYGGNRHGFLPLSEVHPDYYQEKVKERSKVRIQQALKKGQELIVQVIKEESATKGAYLSTYLSLPGRYLVLLVKQSHLGISRKIEKEEERQRLKDLAQKLGVPSDMGVIVRTVGEQGKQRTLSKDLNFLLKLWKDIQKAAEKKAPCLLYKDLDVITRTVRDYCSPDIKTIMVDDKEVHAQLKDFLRLVSPNQVRALKLYQDKMPLFIRYQIEDQIERLYSERVQLKSGGGLVINPTEALVAIDVNSGRCLNQCNLEETAYKTNVEAAEEIARQLRLRDLGGLVVIDFIDMRDKKHVKAVEQALKQALKMDKARVTVGHIGKFGLLELSRQRLRPTSEASTYIPCSACQGRGRVKSVTALGLSLLRQMSMQLGQTPCREVQALLPLEVANFLLNQKRKELLALEEQHNLKIIFTARPGLPLEEIQLDYMKTETKEPQATKGEAKESRRAKPVDEIRPGKISPPLTS